MIEIVSIREQFEQRIRIAKALHAGEAGGQPVDALVILMAMISAAGAWRYPGLHKDRNRFVQCVARFGQSLSPCSTQIAVPLLYDHISDIGDQLKNKVPELKTAGLILTSTTDLSEKSLREAGIADVRLREFSYANLLYKAFRCGLLHEYSVGEPGSSRPQTRTDAPISYANVYGKRNIHFTFDWLCALASRITQGVCREMQDHPDGLPAPDRWWVQGGDL